MELLIFYPIAGLCVALALGVIFNNSPVGSAMCLIGMMLGLAAIFVLLQAHFIAVLQIIIYAGAIMVLFMFVIMLLNLKQANSADWGTRDKNLFISISFTLINSEPFKSKFILLMLFKNCNGKIPIPIKFDL